MSSSKRIRTSNDYDVHPIVELLGYPFSTRQRAAVLLPLIIIVPHLAEYAPVFLSHLRGM